MAQQHAKRQRQAPGFADSKAKMNAQEYYELIGRHQHIEQQALRQEVAKEFANEMSDPSSLSKTTHFGNNLFHPPQPPSLPLEQTRTQQFRKAQPWPPVNTIQRAASMMNNSEFDEETVVNFLKNYQKLSDAEIDLAKQVCILMDQSYYYWRKKRNLQKKPYQARYNSATRKYALSKAPWILEIAMTMVDFHLDHIVDIVYAKPIWSADFDAKCQEREFTETTSYEDETEEFEEDEYEYEDDEEEEEEEEESEEQTIASMINKPKPSNMSLEKLMELRQTGKIMDQQSLDDLFNNILGDISGTAAFADNFEIDLEDDEDEEEQKKDQNKNTSQNSKKEQKQKNDDVDASHVVNEVPNINTKDQNKDMEEQLQILQNKYPNMNVALIKQTFIQTDRDFDGTVFQLDLIEQSCNEYETHKQQSNDK